MCSRCTEPLKWEAAHAAEEGTRREDRQSLRKRYEKAALIVAARTRHCVRCWRSSHGLRIFFASSAFRAFSAVTCGYTHMRSATWPRYAASNARASKQNETRLVVVYKFPEAAPPALNRLAVVVVAAAAP